MATNGEKPWPPMGRNGGHQRGVSMAAYGELSMATVMAREFAGVDRGQVLLMPPSLTEWLREEQRSEVACGRSGAGDSRAHRDDRGVVTVAMESSP